MFHRDVDGVDQGHPLPGVYGPADDAQGLDLPGGDAQNLGRLAAQFPLRRAGGERDVVDAEHVQPSLGW